MTLSSALATKISERFTALIAEGEIVLRGMKTVPARYRNNHLTGENYQASAAYQTPDWSPFVEWRTKATTLLAHVLPTAHANYPIVSGMSKLKCGAGELQWGISTLKGIQNDFESGFLQDIFDRIEAQFSADYMTQAESLLADGGQQQFNHVPAAVLAGAVLEKALRTVCGRQNPPLPVITPKGDPKTLNPLIDDLKKAGVINELRAKQLRAWADIRNKAAHGEFDHFSRSDVEQMIGGLSNYLADLLG